MRGEDFASALGVAPSTETPPHAWRRPNTPIRLSGYTRNTSTCVEKTETGLETPLSRQKHLHVRGEDTQ